MLSPERPVPRPCPCLWQPCLSTSVTRPGADLADAAGGGVEGDALLRHAPVRLGHQLDQRVQRDLQPRDVLQRTQKCHPIERAMARTSQALHRILSSTPACNTCHVQGLSHSRNALLHVSSRPSNFPAGIPSTSMRRKGASAAHLSTGCCQGGRASGRALLSTPTKITCYVQGLGHSRNALLHVCYDHQPSQQAYLAHRCARRVHQQRIRLQTAAKAGGQANRHAYHIDALEGCISSHTRL